jgi:hypothetical protein
MVVDTGALALFLGLGAIAIFIFLAVYIYTAIAVMTIAKKTKTKDGWLAFIPIANIYLLTQMAGQNGLLTLIILADLVLGGLATTVLTIWMFWLIAEKIKYPGWMSLLLLIPIVNLIILGVFAWRKA